MGNYQCNIFRDEKHIKGSPFSINVGDKELAHASKVVVSGQTAEAKANTTNYVTIDTSGTGLYSTILARPDDTSSRSLAFRPLHHG